MLAMCLNSACLRSSMRVFSARLRFSRSRLTLRRYLHGSRNAVDAQTRASQGAQRGSISEPLSAVAYSLEAEHDDERHDAETAHRGDHHTEDDGQQKRDVHERAV